MDRRSFVLGTTSSLLVASASNAETFSLKKLVPNEKAVFRYRILFGSQVVGHQNVTVHKRAHDLIEIEHNVAMKIRLLLITVYNFEMKSQEVWKGLDLKRLESLKSDSVEDGKQHVLDGRAVGGGFSLHDGASVRTLPGDVATEQSFWFSAILHKPLLIDTVSGKLLRPIMRKLPDGRWYMEYGKVKAKLRFSGDILAEAEVDHDGHLAKIVRTT